MCIRDSDTIMRLARDMGLDLVERRITRDELYIADEAFFTLSLIHISEPTRPY